MGRAMTMQQTAPRARGIEGFAWAALAVSIFSGWFVVTRLAVVQSLEVWDITALRFGIGAVLLLPALFPRGRPLPARAWKEGLVFSMLWGVPFVLLVAAGLQLTSAAQAASIAPTAMPLFAGVLGAIFLGHHHGWLRWAGYAAIVLGQAALILIGTAIHGLPDPGGILALLGAAALWAVYTLRFRGSLITPIQSAALICFWSALLFLPVYFATNLSNLGSASTGEVVVQGLYQGVLMSAVAVITFNRAVGLLGPAAATGIIALVPVVASTLAIPVLGELPAPAEALAILLIVAGVLLVARPVRRPV
ncbi:MAG: EamA family transporter [Tistrella sp.]|nr:EamA family transporter [Tistrella sp.]